jgi:hypothetical protein
MWPRTQAEVSVLVSITLLWRRQIICKISGGKNYVENLAREEAKEGLSQKDAGNRLVEEEYSEQTWEQHLKEMRELTQVTTLGSSF